MSLTDAQKITIALSVYCVANLIAFPVLLETVADRVGEDYLVLAIGMIYFMSQLILSFLPIVNGKIMNSERRIDIMFSFLVSITIFFLGMLFALWADIKKYEHFGIDNRGTQYAEDFNLDTEEGKEAKKVSNWGLPFKI